VEGVIEDTCQPGTPAAEDATCDGVDDDCDGLIDEDGACDGEIALFSEAFLILPIAVLAGVLGVLRRRRK
jgi:hypothetical protein